MTSFAAGEILASVGVEKAWYNSSLVVTTFSISLEDFASCKAIDCNSNKGLDCVNVHPCNLAKALLAEIAFFNTSLLSKSSLGGSIGRLLFGISRELVIRYSYSK